MRYYHSYTRTEWDGRCNAYNYGYVSMASNVIFNYRGIEPECTWSAYMDVPGSTNKQKIYLGTYNTLEEAIEARDNAEKNMSSYGDRDL